MSRFDVAIVGSGPAGSIAAYVLSRGGASTCLIDPAEFPRDKACGDLVGPRGVRLLEELGVAVCPAASASDMLLVGPSGHRARLVWRPGKTYADHAIAVRRASLDTALHHAALDAGSLPTKGRAVCLVGGPERATGVRLADGTVVRADFVVGADGALSSVASSAGLVDPGRALWGFALRCYAEHSVEVPAIVCFEPERRRAFPGYGWVFPNGDGLANLGLGMGTLHDRSGAVGLARRLGAFVEGLRKQELLDGNARLANRRGGWLKMGMTGTTPARGRVLLVGDAAGLVNPLQGEGISQAMLSGRAAAEAILSDTHPADRYRRFLSATVARFQAPSAALHAMTLTRPRALSAAARALTGPRISRLVADAWALYWNDLIDGASQGWPRTEAAAISALVAVVTAPTRVRNEVHEALRRR